MVGPSRVAPEFKDLWTGLVCGGALWEGGGQHFDVVTGVQTTHGSSVGWTRSRLGVGLNLVDDANGYVTLNDARIQVGLPFSLMCVLSVDTIGNRKVLTTGNWNAGISEYEGAHIAISGTGQFSSGFGDGVGSSSTNRRNKLTTATLNTGRIYTLSDSVRGTNDIRQYVDGVEWAGSYSGTGTSIGYGSDTGFVGRGDVGQFDGQVYAWAVWERALNDAEHWLLGRDPFGLFRPATRRVIAFPTPEVVEEEEEPPGFVPGEGEVYYKLIKIIGVPA